MILASPVGDQAPTSAPWGQPAVGPAVAGVMLKRSGVCRRVFARRGGTARAGARLIAEDLIIALASRSFD